MRGTLYFGSYLEDDGFECELFGAGGRHDENRIWLKFVNDAEFTRAQVHRKNSAPIEVASFHRDDGIELFRASAWEVELHPEKPRSWLVTINRANVTWY